MAYEKMQLVMVVVSILLIQGYYAIPLNSLTTNKINQLPMDIFDDLKNLKNDSHNLFLGKYTAGDR